ncbi:5'-methylthioadenosine/adenosylhomocysteine nucleosidase [Halonatronum saccharophilum]|uniref:5'-methylthioadenosine/adenosylhomocysteine nucleosidase n=1 Tax=Halonatronum saccharophilum TaxID=150060 RepID=UPI0004868742|nr:5'-methylthioadenosine/adenosylhomocysteine nucleosidase [Halonatronum saccharophilum]
MRFGIIGAMEIEIERLKKGMDIEEEFKKANMTFYSGKLKGKKVVLVRSGIGKVNAAVCTQILIDEFEIDKIIFTGVAGAVDPQLDVGDIVISEDVVQHDVDVTAFGRELGEIPELNRASFKADKNLVQMAKEIGEKVLSEGGGSKVKVGRVLSGDQFISNNDKAKWLREKFSGSCTEMEGASVGQVAFLNNIPFVIIRSISDKADGEANISFDEFLPLAARNSYNIVKGILGEI